jgi:hypothetical protein
LRIGCLGWGSLIWDPRTLPREGVFLEGGPRLPIEFSRVSVDGRVTLVIDPSAPLLQSFWVPLAVDDLDDAIEALGRREKIKPDRWSDWVGRRRRGDSEPTSAFEREIRDWLVAGALDAVVWTALPGRGPDGSEGFPDLATLLEYLQSLSGETRSRAEQYVRRTPRVVRTPNRAHFERLLGWHPTDS